MAALGAALGAHQVIPVLDEIEVRAFDPDRLFREVDSAVDDDLARADELARREVELLDPDGAMAVVERCALGRPVVKDKGLAIVVEEKRRIDAVDLLEPHRIRPRARADSWPSRRNYRRRRPAC